jgi:hypothetical protein
VCSFGGWLAGAINPNFESLEDSVKIIRKSAVRCGGPAVDSSEGELRGGLKVWFSELGGKASKASEKIRGVANSVRGANAAAADPNSPSLDQLK